MIGIGWSVPRLHPANRLEPQTVIVVAAVAEIQPEDVYTRLEKGVDVVFRRAGRSKRRNDLRAALALHR